ncbi:MAG: RNA polymerase factor sigma-54 [Armatimonadetes bacterium]|nr:RNA polymerase factor sigma-54 [Armatimonadota bacterium]
MRIRTETSQKQIAGIAPEYIMGKSVLKMSSLELQEFVQAQSVENPALVIEEVPQCPVCGRDLSDGECPACGSHPLDVSNDQVESDDWHEEGWLAVQRSSESDTSFEPLSVVASPQSLRDYLKEQIRTSLEPELYEIADFIVDVLDEDGYLREPLIDMASRLGLSVPELESVLEKVQDLDPPGIAARSLQECLLIQLKRLTIAHPAHFLACVIVRDHWDGVVRMRLDQVAKKIGVSREQVDGAFKFIREHLNPRPASMFRDPWERFAPHNVCRTSPDIEVRLDADGLIAQIVDPTTGRIAVDQFYADLYAEMSHKRNGYSESDRAHVRECVLKAQALIEALEFRKVTLRKIANELLNLQADFFLRGPSELKPMTRKELAARIGVHESTVCRAIKDKTIRLPSGEVISMELLFDSALPVKELVRSLASQRLSDSEIAARLKELGISIARRTVAKYREQLRVPRMEYRIA